MNYIYSNTPIEAAATDLANKLFKHLSSGERVLFLMSGGSSIPISIMASKILKGVNLSNLYVSLTDERYGEVGHAEENWQQLIDGGLDLPGANLYRPLIGQDIDKTTKLFGEWIAEQLNKADFSIAIFGMGADGHTAGIKPGSKAAKSTDIAVSFKGDDFERITISLVAITRINEAIIQASGANKKAIIHDLLYYESPIEDQPAQVLKSIPESTIYTNNRKEEL